MPSLVWCSCAVAFHACTLAGLFEGQRLAALLGTQASHFRVQSAQVVPERRMAAWPKGATLGCCGMVDVAAPGEPVEVLEEGVLADCPSRAGRAWHLFQLVVQFAKGLLRGPGLLVPASGLEPVPEQQGPKTYWPY